METATDSRASTQFTPSTPFLLNTRLVAAVQTNAGAHCHESANLLQAYYFRAEVYQVQLRNKNASAAEAARRSVHQAEVRLRQFLTNLLWPSSLGATGQGCSTCDCNALAC
jgi:hypothetical protein